MFRAKSRIDVDDGSKAADEQPGADAATAPEWPFAPRRACSAFSIDEGFQNSNGCPLVWRL